ncbi:hypothetical protein QQZ08_010933 [Neonectria magnoliae]|uniref:Uncharacterized protein n=1 Tax=Neonectria magnoliae TaxID=2732573 RepID=A0ABR1HF82_9HYPO
MPKSDPSNTTPTDPGYHVSQRPYTDLIAENGQGNFEIPMYPRKSKEKAQSKKQKSTKKK